MVADTAPTLRLLVKLSSETFIKSRSVRKWHTKQLRRNIQKILGDIDPGVKVIDLWDRLEIACDPSRASACASRLADIPGINHIETVDGYALPDEDPVGFIAERAVHYYSDKVAGQSFAVRCQRSGQHDFTSPDVNCAVGAVLLQECPGATVQLKKPAVPVYIEILNRRVYFVREKVPGQGGYPLGTQGTVLSLISGGFDSSVATYEMMRRGCKANFLFFNLGGTAHLLGAQQAALYLWQRFGSSAPSRFISVPLEGFVAELAQRSDKGYHGVLLKRAMMRIADQVARKDKTSALVTGESIAQVSSQTLANLSVIDRATDYLIIRPLITRDKTDIMDIAERIGSAVFARNMVEYCGVISNRPTVNADPAKVAEIEADMGDGWYEQAVAGTRVITVAEIIKDLNQQPQVAFVADPAGYQVIDIRAVDKPDPRANLHIPFYQLNQRYPELDANHRYLLYCDKGVMSQLHAAYLHELGYNDVKVYRPD